MKPPDICPFCGGLPPDWKLINSYRHGYHYGKAFWGSFFFGKTLGALAGLHGKRVEVWHCNRCGSRMEYERGCR